MQRLKIIFGVMVFGILVLLSWLLIPKQYEVAAFEQRIGTQYWQLVTGSKIGYTKIETSISPKKNPIIYLHGGPGGQITDDVIEGLGSLNTAGHDIYFYDQIGSGHSDRLKDITAYTVNRHREDLEAIVSEIGSQKVVLIGKSWGACLAINYLAHHPESVEKIILMGPGPILPFNTAVANEIPPDSLALRTPEYSNQEGNKKAYNWRSRMVLKWAYLFHSKLATDEEMDDFFTYLNQELSKSTVCEFNEEQESQYTGGGGYYSHIMTMKSIDHLADKRDKLKTLETPILILRGQCDNQKWGYTKEYLDLFVNSDLVILDGIGHSIINNGNDEYLRLIHRFLVN